MLAATAAYHSCTAAALHVAAGMQFVLCVHVLVLHVFLQARPLTDGNISIRALQHLIHALGAQR
jgi:hypothetical protein